MRADASNFISTVVMTIFVAALFLPHTVHFRENIGDRAPTFLANVPRTPSQVRVGDYTSTFITPSALPTIPEANDSPLTTFPFRSIKGEPGNTSLSAFKSILSLQENSQGQWDHSHSRNDGFSSNQTWTIQPSKQGNDGLKAAVRAACHEEDAWNIKWVGTLGVPLDTLDEQQASRIRVALQEQFSCLAVLAPDRSLEGHYYQYCKIMLSPVFHGQIPDHPRSTAYQDRSWVYYREVNQSFANCIADNYKEDDFIWVHDYHLLLVPSLVRLRLPKAKIGFYLHVAFPSSEVFRCLATRKELLDGMLGADLIGFQTQEYCLHFLQACSRILNVEAKSHGIQLEGRFIKVATLPIGVDSTELDRERTTSKVDNMISMMKMHFSDKHLVVGYDKLDNISGLRQKLLAYEMFLDKYPKYRDRIVLLQVISAATDRTAMEILINDIAARINSRYSSYSHQPLLLLKQNMNRAEYLALLSVANALMITSLCEGMNLTSHEYILCQDGRLGNKKHGSLILSEFVGSASLFKGDELSVNPWDYRQCAEAMRKTLEMSTIEKKQRWERLVNIVKDNTGNHWFRNFLEELNKVCQQQSQQEAKPRSLLSATELAEGYQGTNIRLFVLKYEGTLGMHEADETYRLDQPHRTINTLTDLTANPANVVYVMSSKTPEELEMIFQRVPQLGIIAENGCIIKDHATQVWQETVDTSRIALWKTSVSKTLEYYQIRTEGSWVEERTCSLRFRHDCNPPNDTVTRQMVNCSNHIKETYEDLNVQVLPIDDGIVIQSTECDKGTAAEHIFRSLLRRGPELGTSHPDFLLIIGNSRQDEVVYRWANQLHQDGIVRHVTTASSEGRDSAATKRLAQGATGVVGLLRTLAALPSAKKGVRASLDSLS